jgi:hypothetical protein
MGGKRGAVKGDQEGINDRREGNAGAAEKEEGQKRIPSAAIRGGRDKIWGFGIGVHLANQPRGASISGWSCGCFTFSGLACL